MKSLETAFVLVFGLLFIAGGLMAVMLVVRLIEGIVHAGS